jgi:pyridoxamine 5'-phosphate oxidase
MVDLDALPDLDPSTVDPDPIAQFDAWLGEARGSQPRWADAMVLATVGPDGAPSARAVLLRGHDGAGFRFHTNYNSHKGRELAGNPKAALVFLWWAVERQVRVEGVVERLGAEESDAYWATRPRGSQISAWASPQSTVVVERSSLHAATAAIEARYAGGAPGGDGPDGNDPIPIPRPEHWGGFLLRPHAIELWQGRTFRLHDRVRYRRDDSPTDGGANVTGWIIERLAP